MTESEAQQYLRQQINNTRILLAKLLDEPSLPAQRALTQACLSSLELGFVHFLTETFEVPRPLHLLEFVSMPLADTRAKQSELKTLLEEPYWLYQLCTYVESLHFDMHSWGLHGLNTSLAGSDTGVIASNRVGTGVPHWTQLGSKEIAHVLGAAEEFLDRYTDADQEY